MNSVWLCPTCNSESGVYDSRPSPRGHIIRQRKCLSCSHRWTTYEISESPEFRAAINTIAAYFPPPKRRRPK